MKQAYLKRGESNDKQTLGKFYFSGDGEIKTLYSLELPWKDNQKNISCIPTGTYLVTTTYSNKYKRMMWLINDVPDRDGVRIHSGNYYYDIEGCILLGFNLYDINKDNQPDVTSSKDAIKYAKKYLGETFMLTIE